MLCGRSPDGPPRPVAEATEHLYGGGRHGCVVSYWRNIPLHAFVHMR
ncbi:hypothetical protein FHY11_000488 [Xanthomonas arboricola]|nr:hypothetical protein [Xanthomonas euroxanthea]